MSDTPAPFRSGEMTVLPEWIDFNGHLNMAYYNVLFDQGVDQAYSEIGLGPEYQRTGCTTYVAEFHVCYLRELKRVTASIPPSNCSTMTRSGFTAFRSCGTSTAGLPPPPRG